MAEETLNTSTPNSAAPAPQTAEDPAVEQTSKTEQVKEITDTTPDAVDPLLDGHYATNPFFYEVANFFGIEQEDYEVAKEKLAAIVDWAYQETGSKKPEDILLKLRELEDKVQPAQWGEKRYTNVYRYIRLASQKQSVEKAMQAFERSK